MPEGNQPFVMKNVEMTGSWVKWTIPNVVNSFLIQARTDVPVEIADNAAGANKFTLKAKRGIVLGSFNTNNQELYFKGTAGVIVEIITIRMP